MADSTRRRFLRRAGAAGVTVLGGCTGGDGETTTTRERETAEGTTAATTEWSTTAEATRTTERPLSSFDAGSKVGVSHVDPAYTFTDADALNEGGERIAALGASVAKTYLDRAPEKYAANSEWPESFGSMVATADHEHYRDFFARGFDTHVLTAYSHVGGGAYFTDGVSDDQYEAEAAAFADLAEYLLETYDGTGKTFVLQHWEGDWHLLEGYDTTAQPTDAAVEGMTRWLRARQAGVERGRDAVDSDASVLHAPEVNRVRAAMSTDKRRVTTAVLPDVETDLVSYSAWDLCGAVAQGLGADTVAETLDFVAEHASGPSDAAKDALGEDVRGVYLGEYGWPFVQHGRREAMRVTRTVTDAAVRWGVPYAVYWQLYCNELRDGRDGESVDGNDVRGFYLVKPDGSEAASWDYVADLLG